MSRAHNHLSIYSASIWLAGIYTLQSDPARMNHFTSKTIGVYNYFRRLTIVADSFILHAYTLIPHLFMVVKCEFHCISF